VTSFVPVQGHNVLGYIMLGHEDCFVVCASYDADKFLRTLTADSSTSTLVPLTPEELKVDKIILSWILFTLSDSLRARLVVARPKSAKEAWSLISEIVQDNKRSHTIALKAKLRSVKLGDQTMESYFQKIDSIVTILTSLGSHVNEEDIVHYVIDGLPPTYHNVCDYMHWKYTFPNLKVVRSLLLTEEMRLKSTMLASPMDSLTPMVLLAGSSNNSRNCRYGALCRYDHDATARVPNATTGFHKGRGSSATVGNNDNNTSELLNKLITQLGTLGLHIPSTGNFVHGTNTTNIATPNSLTVPPIVYYANTGLTTPPGFPMQTQVTYPAGPAMPTNSNGPLSATIAQPATVLPHAFNIETLQDPSSGAWNMDTGASSHLNNSTTSLSTVLNSCMYSTVLVGDGHSIPVTNTGHRILPTPLKSLRLNNVLIIPHIVKNLISVRQFVRDNDCTIEFDSFGFSVKDFMTRRVLFRCDSTGDLYPVTAPSPFPHAFLVSQHMWHQRLGHPGSDVLCRLVSNNVISCNKEKPPVLCHACQLGKHVWLPFISSNTIVSSCFDIVHSDVWTSPIPSLSGFQYYVLFLDHYSQFVWVYPLVRKSDVLSKFILFRNSLNPSVKFMLFNVIMTSQQNGKSERMVRTLNNIIQTLLFQAKLPPTYWVEALHMAVHILNILPSTAINNEVSFTRLFGTSPDYSLLRIFGCLCYPHLYPNHKLETRATLSLFLGHTSNHRGYRCLDLTTNKIIISRHVIFDETNFPYGFTPSTTVLSYTFLDELDINPPPVSISSF
ncbi:ribonuclease H-like domain-containing protein, partial [Tanacetum coccineum]